MRALEQTRRVTIGGVLRAANQIWDKALIACVTLGALLPSSPLYLPVPLRDSGVYLYIGWRILNGEVPYRDVWDHKPPLVYYIDALGLSITPHSRWGVWLLEWAALSVAAYIGFLLIRKMLGTLPAVLSTCLWLLGLIFVISGGNMTEEYALPLQFGCLWLIYDSDESRSHPQRLFLAGVLCGIAFFLKQTTIGIGAAIVVYLLASRLSTSHVKRLLHELLWMAAGGLAVFEPVVFYFAAQGALRPFWDAAFVFNLAYASAGGTIIPRLMSLNGAIEPLAWVWLLQISLAGYVIGLWTFFKRMRPVGRGSALLLLCLIDLPIELILIALSGKSYWHYSISALPALAVFCALTFWAGFSHAPGWARSNLFKGIFAEVLAGFLFLSSAPRIAGLLRQYEPSPTVEAVIAYIGSSTARDDTVLIWGAEASLNYQAQRRSPSRFVYLTPLYQPGYGNQELIDEFLGDLMRDPPRLIINTNNALAPMYGLRTQSAGTKSVIGYLTSHYQLQETWGRWAAYQYSGSPVAP